MPRSAATNGRRTQKERVEESNRRLRDAAAELLAERGVERTTVAEIGRRAGFSHAMVNNRYGSKDRLLKTLFAEPMQQRLVEGPEGARTGLEGILEQLDQVIEFARSDPGRFRALIVLAFEMRDATLPTVARHGQWIEAYTRRLTSRLAEGQADGTVRGDLDIAAEVDDLLTRFAGLCFRWSLDWDGFPMIGALTRLRDHLEARVTPA